MEPGIQRCCRVACEVRGRSRSRRLVVLTVLACALGAVSCATRAPEVYRAYPVPCIWPTPAAARTVTSEFGEARSAGGGGSYRHQGVDIRAPKGWPVYATADGVVCTVDRDRRGYGKYVAIRHSSGYSTLYAHLSEVDVKEGEAVRAGRVIGEIGKTGRASGYHLHYEVRENGAPINPRPFLPSQ